MRQQNTPDQEAGHDKEHIHTVGGQGSQIVERHGDGLDLHVEPLNDPVLNNDKEYGDPAQPVERAYPVRATVVVLNTCHCRLGGGDRCDRDIIAGQVNQPLFQRR